MAENDVKTTHRRSDRSVMEGSQYLLVHTPSQLHFLARLERLISIKNSYRDHPSQEKWLEEAVGRAIYSTLRDCIELDTGEEAKAMLRRQDWAN